MPTLFESYTGNVANQSEDETCSGNNWSSQVIVPTVNHALASLQLYVKKTGAPWTLGTVTIRLRAVDGNDLPTGADLSTGVMINGDITTSYSYVSVTMSSYALVANTRYAIIASVSGGDDALDWRGDYWGVGGGGIGTGYTTAGGIGQSSNGGSTWSGPLSEKDLYFKEYGNATVGKAGQIAVVETRFHYIDAYGQERYLEGTPV